VLGVELFEQIRAASAPTAFRYSIALEPGEELRQLADGSIALLGQAVEPPDDDPEDLSVPTTDPIPAAGNTGPTGIPNAADQLMNADHEVAVAQNEVPDREVLLTVSAPWARDSAGTAVPTSLSASGDTITMTVDHHAGAFAYPVIADPKANAKGCYTNARRPYRFKPDPGKRGNIPTCRRAVHGTIDKPPKDQHELNPGTGKGHNASEQARLKDNPNNNGRNLWPLSDSLANPFAYLEWVPGAKPTDATWNLYDVDPQGGVGGIIEQNRKNVGLVFAGSGCMLEGSNTDYGVFVVTGLNTVPGTSGKLRGMMKIGGFYERNPKHPGRFPGLANRGSKGKGWNKQAWVNDNPPPNGHDPTTEQVRDNDSMARRFASGCGRDISSGSFDANNINDPSFEEQRYIGDSSPRRGCDVQSGAGCGRYSNYQGPTVTGHGRNFASVVDMTSSTTGVGGGAVVRAIFRVDQGWRRQDRFGYADPNVPCSQDRRVARWRYGIVVHNDKIARGWVPTRLNQQNRPHC
jgi:hypothetical protein